MCLTATTMGYPTNLPVPVLEVIARASEVEGESMCDFVNTASICSG